VIARCDSTTGKVFGDLSPRTGIRDQALADVDRFLRIGGFRTLVTRKGIHSAGQIPPPKQHLNQGPASGGAQTASDGRFWVNLPTRATL
jgi:hypothetical protein